MLPRNTLILFAAFFSLAAVLLPFIVFDIRSSPHNQYAGILEYFRSSMDSEIPSINGKGTEYNLLKDARSLPISGDSVKEITKSVPDFQQLNKDIDEETGINFFKFFKWLWQGIKGFFGFVRGLIS